MNTNSNLNELELSELNGGFVIGSITLMGLGIAVLGTGFYLGAR